MSAVAFRSTELPWSGKCGRTSLIADRLLYTVPGLLPLLPRHFWFRAPTFGSGALFGASPVTTVHRSRKPSVDPLRRRETPGPGPSAKQRGQEKYAERLSTAWPLLMHHGLRMPTPVRRGLKPGLGEGLIADGIRVR